MAVQRRTRRSTGSNGASSRGGLGNVANNLKQTANRWKRPEWVKFEDGETKVVRLVDVGSDFRDGWVHQVDFEGGKSRKAFTKDVMCLDQKNDGTPCPGCRDDLERRFKFWARVIEREADVVNDSGKVTGYKDQIKILSGGKRLAQALEKKAVRKNIGMRDIEIEREGQGWDTDYTVEWVDEEDSPLTKAEIKMIEESDIDLDRYAYMPDFDTFFELPGREDEDEDERPGDRAKRGSAFGERKKRAKFRTSDNGGDEDDRPKRRGRTVKSSGGLADIKKRKQAGGKDKPAIRRRRSS